MAWDHLARPARRERAGMRLTLKVWHPPDVGLGSCDAQNHFSFALAADHYTSSKCAVETLLQVSMRKTPIR
jgi:hypothetical protein